MLQTVQDNEPRMQLRNTHALWVAKITRAMEQGALEGLLRDVLSRSGMSAARITALMPFLLAMARDRYSRSLRSNGRASSEAVPVYHRRQQSWDREQAHDSVEVIQQIGLLAIVLVALLGADCVALILDAGLICMIEDHDSKLENVPPRPHRMLSYPASSIHLSESNRVRRTEGHETPDP